MLVTLNFGDSGAVSLSSSSSSEKEKIFFSQSFWMGNQSDLKSKNRSEIGEVRASSVNKDHVILCSRSEDRLESEQNLLSRK